MTEAQPQKSDLGVRTLSAVVMVAVAGTALWLGGWWWTAFVLLVTVGVLREWTTLANGFVKTMIARLIWFVGGVAYVGMAGFVLMALRNEGEGLLVILALLLAVIATDVGAYFSGRTFGGPKIAPRISPSKTWSGLVGGMLLSAIGLTLIFCGIDPAAAADAWWQIVLAGMLIAVVAQSGDFFESWMKRRAGVKDSSNLIPGHGGLFDRLDGLLAVLFVAGLMALIGAAWPAQSSHVEMMELHQ
ncbi:phosphatidate cytidylyltransferase [Novosphingobium lentum]|uniref:phosphatidate cytidylyltransferase n=1 Tax=Novosphingobium lentum TaxID=145287 RepID=UPI000832E1BB|nr:phosphatidate cytidylyltransferase [Novosphingobium lentum]